MIRASMDKHQRTRSKDDACSPEPAQRKIGASNRAAARYAAPTRSHRGAARANAPIQCAAEGAERAAGESPRPDRATSEGAPLPAGLAHEMSRAFGEDLSDVRIHEGEEASKLRAKAFTQGNDLYFKPGLFNPDTSAGRELIGHELTHVIQQRAGRVTGGQAKDGVSINSDAALEAEADELGARAARGEQVAVPGRAPARDDGFGWLSSVVQCQNDDDDEKERDLITTPLEDACEDIQCHFYGDVIDDARIKVIVKLIVDNKSEFAKPQFDRIRNHAKGKIPNTKDINLLRFYMTIVYGTDFGHLDPPEGDIGVMSENADMLGELHRVLTIVPAQHTAGNPALERAILKNSGSRDSDYTPEDKQINVHNPFYELPFRDWIFTNLSKKFVDNMYWAMHMGKKTLGNKGDALHDLAPKVFDWAVLHEVGHAVDDQLGASKALGHMSFFGGWKAYTDTSDLVADIKSDAGITDQRNGWVSSLTRKWDDSVLRDEIERGTAGAAEAGEAIRIGHTKPFFTDDGGGKILNGHIYQKCQNGEWGRYDASARSKKISNYQFASPDEFFAEHYALYYIDKQVLQDKNPGMFDMIEDDVHKSETDERVLRPFR